ncbi:hypothetical protein [Humidesulfovibrio idahonensis]
MTGRGRVLGDGASAPAKTLADASAFTWRLAALVFLLALIPRLAHVWFVRATPLAGEYVPDLSAYLFAVEKLMQGAYFFAEPMLMSPGYALVLAPQYILVGPDIPVFVLVNAVLDAASAALCACLTAGIAGQMFCPPSCSPSASAGRVRLAGLLAGVLYAFCGPLLFYDLLPLGEGPAAFFLLAGLVLLFAAGRPARPSGPLTGRSTGSQTGSLTAWLAGAVLALAALLRPNLAPAVLLALAAWCVAPGQAGSRPGMSSQDRRARLSAAGRCLAGMLLVFAPFMVHNAAVAGRPSPFGFQGGFTLYTGNHPGASGVGDPLPGFDNTPYLVIMQAWTEARARTGQPLSLAAADAYWYGRTWDFFAGHPAEAAGLLARKTLLLVNGHGVDATADVEFCARFSPVPGWLRLPVGLLFALAAAGLWNVCRSVCRRADQHAGQNTCGISAQAVALAVLLAVSAALVVLFQVTPRYRAVLLPLAIPFAALALTEIPFGRRTGWRGRVVPLALACAVLAASVIPLRLLVDKPGLAVMEHARLGRYYLLKGQHALAAQEYRGALRLLAPGEEGAGQLDHPPAGQARTTPIPAGSGQSGSGAAAGLDPAELRAGLAASLLLGGQLPAPRP